MKIYNFLIIFIFSFTVNTVKNNKNNINYNSTSTNVIYKNISMNKVQFIIKYKKYINLYEENFIDSLFYYSEKLNISPNLMCAFFMNESFLNAKEYNVQSGAVGLFQLTQGGLSHIGYTKEEVLNLSQSEQVRLFYLYLKPSLDKINEESDYIIALSVPSYLGYDDNTIVCNNSSIIYKQNPYWDLNQDGLIKICEIKQHFLNTNRENVRYFLY